jgi:hypothetical protein
VASVPTQADSVDGVDEASVGCPALLRFFNESDEQWPWSSIARDLEGRSGSTATGRGQHTHTRQAQVARKIQEFQYWTNIRLCLAVSLFRPSTCMRSKGRGSLWQVIPSLHFFFFCGIVAAGTPLPWLRARQRPPDNGMMLPIPSTHPI